MVFMIELTGSSLHMTQMKDILYKGSGVSLDKEALERVKKSRAAVEKIVREDRTVYGINTGFGKFSDVKIDEKDTKALQLHLIRSHSCGIGEPFS
jgi:histidine ammonia-lyase